MPRLANNLNQRVTSIIEQVRQLSREEQKELLDRLGLEFLVEESEGTPKEIEADWVEEVQRRIERFERGETTDADFDGAIGRARAHVGSGVTHEDMMAEIRTLLSNK